MSEPDPLADTDIYATIKVENEEPVIAPAGNPEDTEMDQDINDLLNQSFTRE